MNITSFPQHNQLFLDLNISIPFELAEQETALLLLLQNLDYCKFFPPKKKTGRPSALDPYTMMIILLYARTQGKYSSRELERLCTRDLFLIKVLDGRKAPDHCTFDRFVHTHEQAIDQLFFQVVGRLEQLGELTKDVVYQDGTKIESKAGRYSFVWKKVTLKNQEKLSGHIHTLISEVSDYYQWEIPTDDLLVALEEIRSRLTATKKSVIPETSGRGHRLTAVQRFYRDASAYHEKLTRYQCYLASMQGRNSMSKTDSDATFMRMKDDYMKNGQLKPAYNLQVLVDGGYTVGAYASADRTDYVTLIPALDHMHKHIDWTYRGYCADSGYDSQQNFEALAQRGITAYIKPQNYEQSKKRKRKQDIGRRQNMEYDECGDFFVCAAGRKLIFKQMRKSTNQYGYTTQIHIYYCKRGCRSCNFRKVCMKKNTAKYKHLYVNRQLATYHDQALESITSDRGKEVRVNRSIQAEGVFAQIKGNWSFRRFLRSGMKGIYTEWLLVCLAMNAVHLGNKLARNQMGTPFFYRIAENTA
ncbi:MAG: IS1182 family transposase [Bacteroidetes bacterium]|nr:IS1182 family transposase [Bacteroidota bacterium]